MPRRAKEESKCKSQGWCLHIKESKWPIVPSSPLKKWMTIKRTNVLAVPCEGWTECETAHQFCDVFDLPVQSLPWTFGPRPVRASNKGFVHNKLKQGTLFLWAGLNLKKAKLSNSIPEVTWADPCNKKTALYQTGWDATYHLVFVLCWMWTKFTLLFIFSVYQSLDVFAVWECFHLQTVEIFLSLCVWLNFSVRSFFPYQSQRFRC